MSHNSRRLCFGPSSYLPWGPPVPSCDSATCELSGAQSYRGREEIKIDIYLFFILHLAWCGLTAFQDLIIPSLRVLRSDASCEDLLPWVTFSSNGGLGCLFAEWQMEQLIDTVWEVGAPPTAVALPHNESWVPGACGTHNCD